MKINKKIKIILYIILIIVLSSLTFINYRFLKTNILDDTQIIEEELIITKVIPIDQELLIEIEEKHYFIISSSPTNGMALKIDEGVLYVPDKIGNDEFKFEVLDMESNTKTIYNTKLEIVHSQSTCNFGIKIDKNKGFLVYDRDFEVNFEFIVSGICKISDFDIYIGLGTTKSESEKNAQYANGNLCKIYEDDDPKCRVYISDNKYKYIFEKEWFDEIKDFEDNDYYLIVYATSTYKNIKETFGPYQPKLRDNLLYDRTNLYITPSFLVLPYNYRRQLKLNVVGGERPYTFKSTNENLVKVDSNGYIERVRIENGGIARIIVEDNNVIKGEIPILCLIRGDTNGDAKVNAIDQNNVVVGMNNNIINN